MRRYLLSLIFGILILNFIFATPKPYVYSFDCPDFVKVGDYFKLKVKAKMKNDDADYGYLSVTVKNADDVEVYSEGDFDYVKIYPPGSKIWHRDGYRFTSKYWLVDGYKEPWNEGDKDYYKIKIWPDKDKDYVKIYVHATAEDKYNYPSSGTKNEQGWPSKTCKVEILEPEIKKAYWSKSSAGFGEWVELCVETKGIYKGEEVKFEIWEDDSTTGDDYVTTLYDEIDSKGKACVSWKVIEMSDPGSCDEYYFIAKVDGEEKKSSILDACPKCNEGYTGNKRCRGNVVEEEYQYSDCSKTWKVRQDCDAKDYTTWNSYYSCSGNNVVQTGTKKDYYCSSGRCEYTYKTVSKIIQTCSSNQKCDMGSCVWKECKDFGLEKCMFLGNTTCINNDPYECKQIIPGSGVYCYVKLDDCAADEECVDPTGTVGAHCEKRKKITDAYWSKSTAVFGEIVKLYVETEGFDNGTEAKFRIYYHDIIDYYVDTKTAKINNGTASVDFIVTHPTNGAYYYFIVDVKDQSKRSGDLKIKVCDEGYTGNKRCNGNKIEEEYRDLGCNLTWKEIEDCSDYDKVEWYAKACEGNTVVEYGNKYTYFCEDSTCKYKVTPTKRNVKVCDGDTKCENGECVYKSCEDYGLTRCYSRGETKCIGGDPYKCDSLPNGEMCYFKIDTCKQDEVCVDPFGLEPAKCVPRNEMKPTITKAYWSKSVAKDGEEVKLVAETIFAKEGSTVLFFIYEDDIKNDDFVKLLEGKVKSDGKAEVKWRPTYCGDGFGGAEYYFVAVLKNSQLSSGLLKVLKDLEAERENVNSFFLEDRINIVIPNDFSSFQYLEIFKEFLVDRYGSFTYPSTPPLGMLCLNDYYEGTALPPEKFYPCGVRVTRNDYLESKDLIKVYREGETGLLYKGNYVIITDGCRNSALRNLVPQIDCQSLPFITVRYIYLNNLQSGKALIINSKNYEDGLKILMELIESGYWDSHLKETFSINDATMLGAGFIPLAGDMLFATYDCGKFGKLIFRDFFDGVISWQILKSKLIDCALSATGAFLVFVPIGSITKSLKRLDDAAEIAKRMQRVDAEDAIRLVGKFATHVDEEAKLAKAANKFDEFVDLIGEFAPDIIRYEDDAADLIKGLRLLLKENQTFIDIVKNMQRANKIKALKALVKLEEASKNIDWAKRIVLCGTRIDEESILRASDIVLNEDLFQTFKTIKSRLTRIPEVDVLGFGRKSYHSVLSDGTNKIVIRFTANDPDELLYVLVHELEHSNFYNRFNTIENSILRYIRGKGLFWTSRSDIETKFMYLYPFEELKVNLSAIKDGFKYANDRSKFLYYVKNLIMEKIDGKPLYEKKITRHFLESSKITPREIVDILVSKVYAKRFNLKTETGLLVNDAISSILEKYSVVENGMPVKTIERFKVEEIKKIDEIASDIVVLADKPIPNVEELKQIVDKIDGLFEMLHRRGAFDAYAPVVNSQYLSSIPILSVPLAGLWGVDDLSLGSSEQSNTNNNTQSKTQSQTQSETKHNAAKSENQNSQKNNNETSQNSNQKENSSPNSSENQSTEDELKVSGTINYSKNCFWKCRKTKKLKVECPSGYKVKSYSLEVYERKRFKWPPKVIVKENSVTWIFKSKRTSRRMKIHAKGIVVCEKN